jgi:hypothetical protein
MSAPDPLTPSASLQKRGRRGRALLSFACSESCENPFLSHTTHTSPSYPLPHHTTPHTPLSSPRAGVRGISPFEGPPPPAQAREGNARARVTPPSTPPRPRFGRVGELHRQAARAPPASVPPAIGARSRNPDEGRVGSSSFLPFRRSRAPLPSPPRPPAPLRRSLLARVGVELDRARRGRGAPGGCAAPAGACPKRVPPRPLLCARAAAAASPLAPSAPAHPLVIPPRHTPQAQVVPRPSAPQSPPLDLLVSSGDKGGGRPFRLLLIFLLVVPDCWSLFAVVFDSRRARAHDTTPTHPNPTHPTHTHTHQSQRTYDPTNTPPPESVLPP